MSKDGGDGGRVSDAEVRRVFEEVWETAARTNPMLLATLRADYAFESLQQMIRDCLERGLTIAVTIEHALRELRRTATTGGQPTDTCEPASRSVQS